MNNEDPVEDDRDLIFAAVLAGIGLLGAFGVIVWAIAREVMRHFA